MRDLHFITTILLLILFSLVSSSYQAKGSTSAIKNNKHKSAYTYPLPPSHKHVDCSYCPVPPPPAECPVSPPPPPPPKPECPVSPSPPPPPPKPPQPPPPPPQPIELRIATRAIQKFRTRITSDPQGITKTWVGNNICKDSSKYRGFICDKSQNDRKLRVVGLKFNGFNFGGASLNLQGFIGDLQNLVLFHVNSNSFTGTVPYEIIKLPTIYELDLSNNKLTGPFPRAVLGATNLTVLDLRFNELSGPIPAQVFTLDLDLLYLNNNNFNGQIPENLGSSPVLFLNLANNMFSGPIPKSIGQASNVLREVLFLNNQLSGYLPYEIGKLEKATIFDASKNMLTGSIPYSFGCLGNMKQLNLSFNQLFGEVPEILCMLGRSNLFELSLQFNYFTHIGPECWNLIERKVLDLSMNCVLGLPSQRSAAECYAFFLKLPSYPDKSLFTYIPCDIMASEKRSDGTEAPSPSYAALIQHRP